MKSASHTADGGLLSQRGFGFRLSREFLTVVISTVVLIALCYAVAPSSITFGALAGSLPFAAIGVIVGLGQMLVVQQGGFDLSVAGGVSLAVVVSTHFTGGDSANLGPAVLAAFGFALAAGIANGVLIGFLRLNAIVATIGMNALLYAAVFAVSGGIPRTTTPLLESVASGDTLGLGNSVYIAIVIVLVVTFVLKKTVAGRRFEAIGANPSAARAVGLHVRLHRMMAYVFAQLPWMASAAIAGAGSRPPPPRRKPRSARASKSITTPTRRATRRRPSRTSRAWRPAASMRWSCSAMPARPCCPP